MHHDMHDGMHDYQEEVWFWIWKCEKLLHGIMSFWLNENQILEKRTKNEALRRFRSAFPDFCCSFIFHGLCEGVCAVCASTSCAVCCVLCAVCCQRVNSWLGVELLSGEIYKYCTACCCTVRCVYCEVYSTASCEFQTVDIRFDLSCEQCTASTMHDA
jgi:hypothetical protein